MHSGALSDFFGDVLRRHRKAKGLTQEELAENADIASKMVSLIERYERNPSLNIADALANGLGGSLWELIKEAEEMKRKHRLKKG
jgi:transcriptional regulator with XRE-family HTH domain